MPRTVQKIAIETYGNIKACHRYWTYDMNSEHGHLHVKTESNNTVKGPLPRTIANTRARQATGAGPKVTPAFDMCTNYTLMDIYTGETAKVNHPVYGYPTILGPFSDDILHTVLHPDRDGSMVHTLQQTVGTTGLQLAIPILGDIHFRMAVIDKDTVYVMDPLYQPTAYPP